MATNSSLGPAGGAGVPANVSSSSVPMLTLPPWVNDATRQTRMPAPISASAGAGVQQMVHPVASVRATPGATRRGRRNMRRSRRATRRRRMNRRK